MSTRITREYGLLVAKLEVARDALTTRSEDPAFSEEEQAIYDQLANDLDRIVVQARDSRAGGE